MISLHQLMYAIKISELFKDYTELETWNFLKYHKNVEFLEGIVK